MTDPVAVKSLLDAHPEITGADDVRAAAFNKRTWDNNGILTYRGIYVICGMIYSSAPTSIGRAAQILNDLDALISVNGRPFSDFKQMLYNEGVEMRLASSQIQIAAMSDTQDDPTAARAANKLLTKTEGATIRGMGSLSDMALGWGVVMTASDIARAEGRCS